MINSPVPAQAKLLVFGLARDCAKRLPAVIETMKESTRSFLEVSYLVVESDSSDNTKEVGEALSKRIKNFRMHSLGSLKSSLPKRTARIAHCRNYCLAELRENPLYAQVDYVIMADLDGVTKDLTELALLSCWNSPKAKPWDMCAGNQGDYYYDIWALRHPEWCPGDMHTVSHALEPYFGKSTALDTAILSKMVHIPRSADWIAVDSAFSGLAVYKRQALMSGSYEGLNEDGSEVCDHVSLHQHMKENGAHLYINPALITAKTTKHGSRRKFFRTQRRKIFEKIKGFF